VKNRFNKCMVRTLSLSLHPKVIGAWLKKTIDTHPSVLNRKISQFGQGTAAIGICVECTTWHVINAGVSHERRHVRDGEYTAAAEEEVAACRLSASMFKWRD
jgi:hypothetical protein